MNVLLIILGVILLMVLLTGLSFLGWIFKGLGAILNVFLEGLSNFFDTSFGCIIKLILLILIIAALCS